MNHLFQHIQGHLYGAFRPRLLPTGGATAFSPLSLFAANEQGVWYDPSDFASMFQDSAGTTPVTAVEQPVGLILDKRLGLALGAELLTNGDFSDGTTGWYIAPDWSLSGGALVAAGAAGACFPLAGSSVVGVTYLVTIDVSVGSLNVFLGGQYAPQAAPGTFTARFTATNTNGISFSTSAGATIDNISVREIAGNHATQPTAAARPVVSARVNLLRYTEDMSNGVWEDASAGVTAKTYGQTDPLGGTTAVKLVGNNASTWFTQNIGAVQAADYTLSMWIRADAPVTLDMLFSYGVNDLVSVNVTTAWQRFSVTAARAATAGLFAGLNVGNGNNIYVWHPQLEIGSTATRYQRVTTASDYDSVGFPHYLAFDGIDDSLVTAAVDLTGTYQVSAFAGASANYVGNYAPLYANGWAYESGEPNAGLFSAYIPKYGSGTVRFDLGGVTTASNVTVSVDITAAHVYMQSMDSTASPYQVIRVDGAQVATGTVNVGGQPFAGTAVKIADRYYGAGASFFSGKLYQLIIRGAASTEAEINATEAYIASKSGVTL